MCVCYDWCMEGKTLKAKREVLGMTQAELGRRLGTSQQTVFKWESGERNVQHPPMMELALRYLALERMIGGQVDVWGALGVEQEGRDG